jgi:hypothetical protein
VSVSVSVRCLVMCLGTMRCLVWGGVVLEVFGVLEGDEVFGVGRCCIGGVWCVGGR